MKTNQKIVKKIAVNVATDLCPYSPLQGSFNQIYSNRPFVKLVNGSDSAAKIHQVWDAEKLQQFQDCVFHVDSNLYFDSADPQNSQQFSRGLTLSVRKINFRFDPQTQQCIDYVRFTFPASKTDKICGTFDGLSEIGQQTYINVPDGVIKVHIFVDKTKPFAVSESSVELELIFTAYQRMELVSWEFRLFEIRNNNKSYSLAIHIFIIIHLVGYDVIQLIELFDFFGDLFVKFRQNNYLQVAKVKMRWFNAIQAMTTFAFPTHWKMMVSITARHRHLLTNRIAHSHCMALQNSSGNKSANRKRSKTGNERKSSKRPPVMQHNFDQRILASFTSLRSPLWWYQRCFNSFRGVRLTSLTHIQKEIYTNRQRNT